MKTIYATLSLGILGVVGCTADEGTAGPPTYEMLVAICAATADANTFAAGPCCFNQDTGAPALCTDHPPPPELCEEAEQRDDDAVVLARIADGVQVGESPNFAIFGEDCEDPDEPPPPPDEPPPPPDEPDCEQNGYVVMGNETDRMVFTLGPQTATGREIEVFQYPEGTPAGTKVVAPNNLVPHPVLDEDEVFAKLETELYTVDPETGIQIFIGYPHKQLDWYPATCEGYQC